MKFKFLAIIVALLISSQNSFAEPKVTNLSELTDSIGLDHEEELTSILEANVEEMHSSQEPLMHWNLSQKGYSFTFGGFINLRSSYDFNGSIDCADFIPSMIPSSTEEQIMKRTFMDASTSRLYFNALIETKQLGLINLFIESDFRGGSYGSYTPRIRLAYMTFLGVTAGRAHTTFSDLSSMPYSVDFAGPNSCAFGFVTMLRYEHKFMEDRLKLAVALESPSVSATYNNNFNEVPQLTPDIPAYAQYNWGADNLNHIRVSGVYKAMSVKNKVTNDTDILSGWGTQLSGNIGLTPFMRVMFSGTYGEGISNYIVDLIGLGLDFMPNPDNPSEISLTPMYGYQLSTQININPKLWLSAGYSYVNNQPAYDDLDHLDNYKSGTYIFGNCFYSITSRLQIAGEYIYGSRKSQDLSTNSANRVVAMLQFTF
ncbi:MAG: DcaP family trimeric outer membrane transporter [Bacteroidales bacterium]